MLHSLRSHRCKQSASSVALFSIRAITCNSIVPNPTLPVRGTHTSVTDLFPCLQDSILSGKCIFGMDLHSVSWDTCLQPDTRIRCPGGFSAEGLCQAAHERALMHICTRCLRDGRLGKVRAIRESRVLEGTALCPLYCCHCTDNHSLLRTGQIKDYWPARRTTYQTPCLKSVMCIFVLPWTIENTKVTCYAIYHTYMDCWE